MRGRDKKIKAVVVGSRRLGRAVTGDYALEDTRDPSKQELLQALAREVVKKNRRGRPH